MFQFMDAGERREMGASLDTRVPPAAAFLAASLACSAVHAELSNNNAGLGPSVVLLHLTHGDPWVYGALVNNVWSVGTTGNPFNSDAAKYNNGLIQRFLNFTFESRAYLTSSPVITVNWDAKGSQQWTVPMGGGVGKIFKIGRLPVNTQIGGYYNVVRPDFASNWQIRAQVQVMFPK